MTITHTPPAALTVPRNHGSSTTPVSAGNDPIEGRIAAEMSATLQEWLHRLPARSARIRKD